MKKKISIVFIIVLILFNFITSSSYAIELPDVVDATGVDTSDIIKNFEKGRLTLQEGEGGGGSAKKKFDIKRVVSRSASPGMSIISNMFAFFVGGWLNTIPQIIVNAAGHENEDTFTVYKLVTGQYEFFNLDFIHITENNNTNAGLAGKVTPQVTKYYYIMRQLAIGLSLFVLIYVGIRMALASTAEASVKYKNMLTSWAVSLALLYVMHYIIIIINMVSNQLLEMVRNLATTIQIDDVESHIVEGYVSTLQHSATGLHAFTALVMVTAFVYYQIKFVVMYTKRFCEIAFLIVISPLVTITYSIDKVGDNKAQAFNAWLSELITKYAIQVIHAITYVILLSAAGTIAQQMPFVAAIFLWSLGKAEKVVRKVFNINDESFSRANVPFANRFIPRFFRRGG